MGIRELARALRVSPSLVSQLAKRGMPIESVAAAQEWRLRCTRQRSPNARASIQIDFASAAAEDHRKAAAVADTPEELSATLSRLRQTERAISATLVRLLKEDKVAEAVVLRKEHAGVVRSLFDAESKMLRLNEARGRLISVDTALNMISEALAAPVITLRRLPDLARDPEERRRLETFLNAVLHEIQNGAEIGLKRSAAVAR